ncbi:MAG: hypothetical protein IV085_08960 [Thiobacillus sp.]|nr:hypothetical protein [Thiobacillus sp.]
MLTLDVPQTDASLLQHKIETRPKATLEWLARLPFASPIDTAQQLVLALYTLNRVPLDEDARIALMALYRPVVARAAASLEVLLLEAGVPPPPQQRQAGTLLRELQTEYSVGCKHGLRSLSGRRFGRSQIRHIAELTSHLLDALHEIQFCCHLTYSPVPERFWLELHQTYQLAKSNGMSGKSIQDAPPADLVYARALLLELADPPHMSRVELAHLKLYLREFGKLATLGAPPTDAGAHGFPIETHADRGPGAQQAALTEGGLWLDTEAICRHLHEAAIRLRTGDTPRHAGLPAGMRSDISLALSRHLLKLWRPGSQRAFNRYPAPGKGVEVVAGVSAIHRLLELAPQSAELAPATHDAHTGTDSPPQLNVRAAVNASHWTLNNDSAAGLALSGTPDIPLNLKVGDALAVRAADSAVWSLGVIRWIKMHDARQVELGVERLSPTMQPVWVKPLKGRRKAGPEPGLFVPGSPALKQPDRLLLSSHVYHKGMQAEVLHASRQYTVTFNRRAELTPSFDLIDFTVSNAASTS